MELVKVIDIHVSYNTRRGVVKAVDGVSFSIDRSDVFGIAGESGCGKSTTALSILKLLPINAKITQGKILFKGEDLTEKTEDEMRHLRGKQISLVFQAAMNSFDPIIRVGEQIAEAIRVHENIDRENAGIRIAQLFESVGLDKKRLKNYPHEFSGGMKQRAMIAMALSCNPELLIADEPVTALDVITQAQIVRLLIELQRKTGLSVMIISHDLSVLAELCNKIVIMYAGKIAESGDVTSIFHEAAHPYTQALIRAFPNIKDTEVSFGTPIPGKLVDLLQPPAGCRFHPRCKFATDICRKSEPKTTILGRDHQISCHLVG